MTRSLVVFSAAGYANLGDHAMYAAVVHLLRRLRPASPLLHIVGPDQRFEELPSVSTIRYSSSASGLLKSVAALLRAEVLVMVGGSVLHDYYPNAYRRWIRMGRLARLLRRRVIFVGLDAYEPSAPEFERALRRFCAQPIRFLPRSERSAELLRRYGAQYVDPIVDPAFALPWPSRPAHEDLSGVVGVNLRPVTPQQRSAGLTTEAIAGRVAAVLAQLHRELGVRFRYFPFSATGDESDDICLAMVRERLGPHAPIEAVAYTEDPFARLAQLTGLDAMIGMRFHALLFAVLAGVACVGLAYDPKVEDLFRGLGLVRTIGCDFRPEALVRFIADTRLRSAEIAQAQWSRAADFAARVEEALRNALNVPPSIRRADTQLRAGNR